MKDNLTEKQKHNDTQMILTAIKDLHKDVTKINLRVESLEGKSDGFEARFTGLEGRFDGLEGRFDGLEEKFGGLQEKFEGLEEHFSGLERKFDGLEQKVGRIEEKVGDMRADTCELCSRLGIVNRDQLVINDAVRRMQLDFLTVNEWLQKIIDRKQQNSQT